VRNQKKKNRLDGIEGSKARCEEEGESGGCGSRDNKLSKKGRRKQDRKSFIAEERRIKNPAGE